MEVCWEKKNPGGQFGEGAWSSGGRSRIRWGRRPLPAPRLCGGQWELGVDPPLPASQFSQSHPVLLWDGRKSGSCFVIQENTGAQTESLPSSVWMRRVLYLAREVSCHHQRREGGGWELQNGLVRGVFVSVTRKRQENTPKFSKDAQTKSL